jgi:hypothetical protein
MKRLPCAALVLATCGASCGEESIEPAATCSLPTENPVVVAMEAGYDVTLAVKSDGTLWCWGSDFQDRCHASFLGYPQLIVEGECLTTIASEHVAMTSILASGVARLWWLDTRNIDLPDPFRTSRADLGTIVSTEVYGGSVALLNDQGVAFLLGHVGDVPGGRDFGKFEIVDLPVSVARLAPGYSPCVLGANGTAYCIEVNDVGVPPLVEEQGIDVSAFRPLSVPEPVQSFSVGAEQACALADSGTVYCVGVFVTPLLPSGEPTTAFEAVDGLPPLEVLKLSEGGATACGLADGQLWCWGRNSSELYKPEDDVVTIPVQTGHFDTVVDFVVGEHHLCALLDNHEVWCRGDQGAKGICTVETHWEKLTFESCDAFD